MGEEVKSETVSTKKKKGGTLQENLDIVTGRKAAPLNPS